MQPLVKSRNKLKKKTQNGKHRVTKVLCSGIVARSHLSSSPLVRHYACR